MQLLRTDARPGSTMRFILAVAPFILVAALYLWGAQIRHQRSAAENDGVDKEKLMPYPTQMVKGFKDSAFEKDVKTQKRLLFMDTWASMRRFIIAYAFVWIPILLGLHMGTLPYIKAMFRAFLSFFGMVPPLALSAIVILVFGIEELPKIMLIIIGIFPTLTLSACLAAEEVPNELIQSAKARGASEFEVVYRVVLPLIWPKMLDCIRLSFQPAIMCLLAAEFMSATEGLGYRIYLVKRYTAMDVIIPYVLWMTLLLFTADYLVRLWIAKRYLWINKN